jgi:hypothetical protein
MITVANEKPEMRQIGAWIRDPRNNIFKGMSKRCALFKIFCENSGDCDLFKKESTCLLCSATSGCKFGRKCGTEGPTQNASKFFTIIQQWRKENEQYFSALKDLKAYNRIFHTNGFYYLPYSFMSGCGGSPLDSAWRSAEGMTADTLRRICEAQPCSLMGGVIRDYQNEEVPKFISDLQRHYPHLFAILPDEQKDRVQNISFVGRKADLTTCRPGEYIFSDKRWKWDGEFLTGSNMLFQPVKGECEIRIRPEKGAEVKITDNSQVADGTRFLD